MPRAKTNRRRLKRVSCPQCRKKFYSETSVLWHMNQLMGPCYGTNWFQDHSNAPQGHQEDNPASDGSDSESQWNDDYFPPSSPSNFGHTSIDHELGHHGMDLDDSDAQTNFTDIHPGCSKSYTGGATFMDLFWQDKYAEEQRVNLYFPFASAEEWQFSSWCMWLGLSMAAIDSLLSLSIVSHWYLHLELWLINPRLPSFHFHSKPQKNFKDG